MKKFITKEKYYDIYAIIQVFINAFVLFNVSEIANSFWKELNSVMKMYPEDMAKQLSQMFTLSFAETFVTIFGAIGVILGIIILFIARTNNIVNKKKLVIILLIASIVTSLNDFMTIFTIITLIILAKEKEQIVDGSNVTKVKESKKLHKLELMHETNKDRLFVGILVLAYAIQFFIPAFDSFAKAIIFEILFRVGVFALVFYVYLKNFKRDTIELKKNFVLYLKHALKYWGIMLLAMLLVGFIRTICGHGEISENQQVLNSMPIWYIAPLAIIWAPIVEEGLFRIGIRKFIKNDLVFIIVSAISFGLLHTLGQETSFAGLFFQTLQYSAMGAVMAISYVKTNNVWSSMLVHCYQNTFSSVIMLLMTIISGL